MLGDKFKNQETEIVPKFKTVKVGKANISKINAISKDLDAEEFDIVDIRRLSELFDKIIRNMNLPRELFFFQQREIKTVFPVYRGIVTVGADVNPDESVKISGVMYNLVNAPEYVSDESKALTGASAQSAASAQSSVKSLIWLKEQQATLKRNIEQRFGQDATASTTESENKNNASRLKYRNSN